MDLGLQGKTAIICASSQGLGRACAENLAAAGVDLVINGRRADILQETADDVAARFGVTVTPVAADVSTEDGRAALLDACPAPDILVNNAGGPPPGDFRDWERDDWIKALDQNMLAPIALIKATVDGMQDRGFGRVVNITSAAVRAPIPTLGLSNGARSGLTGFVAGLARQTVSNGVTINNLLPGLFKTNRLTSNWQWMAEQQGRKVEDIEAQANANNPRGRIGDPDEFGKACAFLCSIHAGYITGQNWLIDGGAYPGTV